MGNGISIYELTTPIKQALPPGGFVTQSFYSKGGFTFPASPDLVLFVIIRVGAATARTGCPYLSCDVFIQFLPVVIMPLRSNRHCTLLITGAILLYHHLAECGLSSPLHRRAFPNPRCERISAQLGNLYALRRRHHPAYSPFSGLWGR